MSDEEAQQDEMLAMESIFDGEAFQVHSMSGDIRSGYIKIQLDLPEEFFVSVDMDPDPEEDEIPQIPGLINGVEARYQVEFLPPLILHFTLPKNYPSEAKPNFILSSVWLHRVSLSILCQKLDELWEENSGMGILFTWTNYLQANALSELGIHDLFHVDWVKKPEHLSFRNKTERNGSSLGGEGEASAQVLNFEETIAENENDQRILPSSSTSSAPKLQKSNSDTDKPDIEGAAAPSGSNGKQTQRGRKRKIKKNKKESKIAIDNRAALDAIPRQDGKDVSLMDYLLFYNDVLIQETFKHSSHECDICVTMKIGESCVRFHCGHVFCAECVCTCFKTHITEGNVDQVKCPAFNCKIRPAPEVVKTIVGDVLYERYDEILLKRALENMSDITYCPRPKCHQPVICDPNEKCASCTACGHTFCSICKMVYHGVEPCRFKNADMKEVFKKYTEGTKEEKKAMVKAYGEKQLKILCENVLSEQWIQKESKQCPHCKVPIEKFEGCNKVTCFKCNTYFCWICLKQLEQGNPYFHFNDPASQCYNNLFQDVDMDAANEWFVVDDDTSEDDDEDYLDLDSSDFDDDDFAGLDLYDELR